MALPELDVDLLGHGYFGQAEALLHDIYALMRHNDDRTWRQRVTPAFYEGAPFRKILR